MIIVMLGTGKTALNNLSEGLKEIENTAFRFCSSLTELRIPSTVMEISAFINDYQNGLNHIAFEGMKTDINFDRGETGAG